MSKLAAGLNTKAQGNGLTVFSLLIAGVCFFLYPVLRPFSNESTLAGAEAYTSSSWLLAHSLAMVGFILLIVGLLGLCGLLLETRAGSTGIKGLVVIWIGVGLTLPYYGAETFALHAVGKEALLLNSVDLLVTLTNSIRYGAGSVFFVFGLLAIAIGAIIYAVAIWQSGILTRWSGIPLAVAFTLFFPQFYTPPLARAGHGLLVMVGCWLVAWSILNRKIAYPQSIL